MMTPKHCFLLATCILIVLIKIMTVKGYNRTKPGEKKIDYTNWNRASLSLRKRNTVAYDVCLIFELPLYHSFLPRTICYISMILFSQVKLPFTSKDSAIFPRLKILYVKDAQFGKNTLKAGPILPKYCVSALSPALLGRILSEMQGIVTQRDKFKCVVLDRLIYIFSMLPTKNTFERPTQLPVTMTHRCRCLLSDIECYISFIPALYHM